MRLKATTVLLLCICSLESVAQESKQPHVLFSGFANVQNLGEGADIGWTRVFPGVQFGDLSFETELEFAGVDDDRNGEPLEWFNQFNIVWNADNNTQVRVGRSFRAFGYGTFAPVLLKTAAYPRGYPFSGYYAYGVRLDMQGDMTGGNWLMKFDVVAQPEGFRDVPDFSKPELSFVIAHRYGDTYFGASGQLSTRHFREGVHLGRTFEFGDTRRLVNVAGGAYLNSDRARMLSFLGYVGIEALKNLELHEQFFLSPSGNAGALMGVSYTREVMGAELKFIGDFNVAERNAQFRSQIWF